MGPTNYLTPGHGIAARDPLALWSCIQCAIGTYNAAEESKQWKRRGNRPMLIKLNQDYSTVHISPQETQLHSIAEHVILSAPFQCGVVARATRDPVLVPPNPYPFLVTVPDGYAH
jgi:hypothetical protein